MVRILSRSKGKSSDDFSGGKGYFSGFGQEREEQKSKQKGEQGEEDEGVRGTCHRRCILRTWWLADQEIATSSV